MARIDQRPGFGVLKFAVTPVVKFYRSRHSPISMAFGASPGFLLTLMALYLFGMGQVTLRWEPLLISVAFAVDGAFLWPTRMESLAPQMIQTAIGDRAVRSGRVDEPEMLSDRTLRIATCTAALARLSDRRSSCDLRAVTAATASSEVSSTK